MESQFQKWVNLSYLALAALVGYVVWSLTARIVVMYNVEAHAGLKNIDLIVQGLSVAISAILFFVLYRNDRANEFMNEVILELSRVTWPTQKETSSATVVVMAMVLISGLVLGFYDYIWTAVLKLIVR